MKIDLRGKTVLMVGRVGDLHCNPVGKAITKCRACRHDCSISPASIDRLRAEPEIVVLCIECAMEADKAEPFASFAPVSIEELHEALRKRGKL